MCPASSAFCVLIHSPLVGPNTWGPVAEHLGQRGIDAVVPSLLDAAPESGLHWLGHVTAVAAALRGVPADRRVTLIAHSGAGPLLPALGSGLEHTLAGYLFVDAGLPGADGQSRLDLFEPSEARRFREAARDGMIPTVWRDEALLRAVGIEDACLRRTFIDQVPDVPLSVYEEPLPVPEGWPDAPCAYLQLSTPYQTDAHRAQGRRWPLRELPGGHFHMLADPPAVTEVLLSLMEEMRG